MESPLDEPAILVLQLVEILQALVVGNNRESGTCQVHPEVLKGVGECLGILAQLPHTITYDRWLSAIVATLLLCPGHLCLLGSTCLLFPYPVRLSAG